MTPIGRTLLTNRYLNKGTAFTVDERDQFGLHGLLPPIVESLDTQLQRVRAAFDAAHGDLGKHIFLRALQQNNSVLFYRFLHDQLDELLPIVYTPTVGLACEQWSRTYRREHGLYVSYPDRHRIPELLTNALRNRGPVDVVVVTDGERILGLGDLGVGGMGIPIGKLALYTAVGGIDPSRTLPVVLDVGTENDQLLSDPLYLGWRHRRLRDDDYDNFVMTFVDTLRAHCPGVLLQWEDLAQRNATRLLEQHRERICSFNDDIQGTAAVTTAAIVTGMKATGIPLRHLRTVIVGAGSAGVGIARQLTATLVAEGIAPDEAKRRCWLVDRDGLLHDQLSNLQPFQADYIRDYNEVAHLADERGRVHLTDVVGHVAPHALIGVTGQPGLFTEEVVRSMASHTKRPIVLPLSNPTPRAEANPCDVLAWTNGTAIVGTGSTFGDITLGNERHTISQVNNLYVFPGLGRGVLAAEATQVTDAMLAAASTAIAATTENQPGQPVSLLPPITYAPAVAEAVAFAVATQAVRDGVAPPRSTDEIATRVHQRHWIPEYRPLGPAENS